MVCEVMNQGTIVSNGKCSAGYFSVTGLQDGRHFTFSVVAKDSVENQARAKQYSWTVGKFTCSYDIPLINNFHKH